MLRRQKGKKVVFTLPSFHRLYLDSTITFLNAWILTAEFWGLELVWISVIHLKNIKCSNCLQIDWDSVVCIPIFLSRGKHSKKQLELFVQYLFDTSLTGFCPKLLGLAILINISSLPHFGYLSILLTMSYDGNQ